MWEIVCPACRKKHSWKPEDQGQIKQCRRCGCEVEMLYQITAAAAAAYRRAQHLLNSGSGEKALEQAETSWNLRRQPETAQLAFLAALFNADFNKARQWYNLGVFCQG